MGILIWSRSLSRIILCFSLFQSDRAVKIVIGFTWLPIRSYLCSLCTYIDSHACKVNRGWRFYFVFLCSRRKNKIFYGVCKIINSTFFYLLYMKIVLFFQTVSTDSYSMAKSFQISYIFCCLSVLVSIIATFFSGSVTK
jgi:hypothetical protein